MLQENMRIKIFLTCIRFLYIGHSHGNRPHSLQQILKKKKREKNHTDESLQYALIFFMGFSKNL